MISLIKEIPFYMWAIFSFLFLFLLMIIDKALSTPRISYGEVLDKKFKPDPGEFMILVRDWSGKKIWLSSPPEAFYNNDAGDILKYYCHKGLSGLIYQHEVIDY